MKKYAPRKVFILENGEYVEITYEELCRREESNPSYKDKLFLPLYGADILVDDSENVEDQAIRNVTAEEIRFIISMLKPSDQELIQAMFYEGLSERQYAKRCGVNRNAIHKRKSRILEELKKILGN